MTLDLRDLDCPVPVLRTKEALESLEEGILDVELNSLSSIENVKRFVTAQGLFYEEKKLGRAHAILSIVKGYECRLPPESREAGDNRVTVPDLSGVSDVLRAEQIARADRERRQARTFYSLLFLLFGVSVGSLSFLQWFAPYHLWFSLAAVAVVGWLWFDWWRGRRERIACGTSLCRNYTLYLGLGTLFVALMVSYPWWAGFLLMED